MSSRTKMDKTISRQLHCLGLVCLYVFGFVNPVRGYFLKSCRISRSNAKCDSQRLVDVPRDIPPTVTTIDLSKNQILSLQKDDFGEFPILTQLYLNFNKIFNIDKGAFSGLTVLKKLNLNNNKICDLPENVFLHLNTLVELRITHNCIKTVGLNTFKPMTSLKILDISYNELGISNVSVILQSLPHLQEFSVIANVLHTFQSWEVTNTSLNLSSLDLSDNPLKVFSLTADVIPKLTQLRIKSMKNQKKQMTWHASNKTFLSHVEKLDISTISMSLSGILSALETVNSSLRCLRMNAMQRDSIKLIYISGSIPTMTELQIRNNKLRHIGSHLFSQCTNLKTLDVSHNFIATINNDAFEALSNLEVLDLSYNKLSSVPAATRNLSSLKELNLHNNQISAVECIDFANNTNLKELSLSNNTIQVLESCVFNNLRKLQVLKVQGNKINALNGAFHDTLPHLKTLQLFENKITTIKSHDFRGLCSLRNLSLQNNKITTLFKDSFSGLKNLTYLLLDDNHISIKELQKGGLSYLSNLRNLALSSNYILFKENQPLRFPPFSKLSRLEELRLSNQHGRGPSFLPSNLLQGLSNLLIFEMKNVRLRYLDKNTFKWTPRLHKLNIGSNALKSLHPDLFIPLRDITELYFTDLHLQSLNFFISANLTKLVYLQARSNEFSVVRPEVINSLPALLYVDLRENGFICDCDNTWLMQWAKNSTQTQVYQANNFVCSYPPVFEGKKLLQLNVQSCLLDIGFIAFITTTILTLLSMFVPLTYHFMMWKLVYAYYIFLAWLTDTKHKKKQAPYLFDAFVSYNSHDEMWVVQELLPKLEGQQGWKLCLHHRDFEPGKPIIDNITDAIYQSRKTLCVISHKYLESEWCSREIQAASFRLFDENKDVLILVFLEDIPSSRMSPYYRMRSLLRRQSYLSWPKAAEQTGLFWEKLRQALQSREESDAASSPIRP